MFDLPHAETHAVVLPYVLAFNAPAAPERPPGSPRRSAPIDALAGLRDLREDLDAPRALRDLGLRADDLPEAVEADPAGGARRQPAPRSTPRALTALLRAAWAGDDPGGRHERRSSAQPGSATARHGS